MAMSISPEGLDLIKSFEGLATDAYIDPVGIWTIGYGHTAGVKAGQKITPEQADELLRQDVKSFEQGVANLVHVPLNQNEFSALVSFAYNVGLGALKSSTALKRLNAGDRLGAADALEWWNKGRVNGKLYILPGLARRRAAEKGLFLKPTAATPATKLGESGRVPPTPKEEPDRRENLAGSRTVQGGAVAGAAAAAGAVGAASQAVTKQDQGTETTSAPGETTTSTAATTPPAATPTPEAPPAATAPQTPPVSVPIPPTSPAPAGPAEAPSAQPEVPPISPPPNMTSPGSSSAPGTSSGTSDATNAPAPTATTSPPTTASPTSAPAQPSAPVTTGTVATEAKPSLVHQVGNLFDQHPEYYTIVFGLIVIAAIYVLWARADDWLKGRR